MASRRDADAGSRGGSGVQGNWHGGRLPRYLAARDPERGAQARLARALGVSTATVAEWVAGRKRPGAQLLVDLAAYLGLPAEALLRPTIGPLSALEEDGGHAGHARRGGKGKGGQGTATAAVSRRGRAAPSTATVAPGADCAPGGSAGVLPGDAGSQLVDGVRGRGRTFRPARSDLALVRRGVRGRSGGSSRRTVG